MWRISPIKKNIFITIFSFLSDERIQGTMYRRITWLSRTIAAPLMNSQEEIYREIKPYMVFLVF